MDRERIFFLLKLYLGVFVALFIAGLLAGATERKTLVRASAISYIDTQLIDDRIYLVMECNGKRTHVYDVDTNRVLARADADKVAALTAALFSLRAHRELFLSAIGTGSGGVTLQSLGKTRTQRGRGAFIAVIMGFATGYLAGYSVSTYMDLSCSSASILDFLEKESNWEQFERDLVVLSLFQSGVREKVWLSTTASKADKESSQAAYERFEFSPINLCKPEITVQALSLLEKARSHDEIGTADFMIAKSYAMAIQRTRNNDKYRRLLICIGMAAGSGNYLFHVRAERHSLSNTNQMEQVDDDDSIAPCNEFGIAIPKLYATGTLERLTADPMFQKACQIALEGII